MLDVRLFRIKTLCHYQLQYLTNNKHTKHIKHYVRNCSLGDWFVLYQMSRSAPVIVLNNLFLINLLIIYD